MTDRDRDVRERCAVFLVQRSLSETHEQDTGWWCENCRTDVPDEEAHLKEMDGRCRSSDVNKTYGGLRRIPNEPLYRLAHDGEIDAETIRALDLPLTSANFQDRVAPWMQACFGPEIARDRIERNHRFLEEALELVQALGCTRGEAHQLVDYTFAREIGQPLQEVGGVMVTLAALCLASDLDMDAAAEAELARIWTKVDQIRAKQAAKPKHSPLPAVLTSAREVTDEMVRVANEVYSASISAEYKSAAHANVDLSAVQTACMRAALKAALASAPQPACVGVGEEALTDEIYNEFGATLNRSDAREIARWALRHGQSLSPAPSPQAGATISPALLKALYTFACKAFESCWDGGGLGGDDIQEIGVETGLLTETTYDPAVHGENSDFEPGDRYFIYNDELASLSARREG